MVNSQSIKMKLFYLSFFLGAIFSVSFIQAQVLVTEEAAITELMEVYKSENNKTKFVRAWRIQILTTNDRREMEQGIKRFNLLYPHLDYSWEHNPPYYQVRVGAYELKPDLEATLLELKRDFPAALPVQDEMEKKEILEN